MDNNVEEQDMNNWEETFNKGYKFILISLFSYIESFKRKGELIYALFCITIKSEEIIKAYNRGQNALSNNMIDLINKLILTSSNLLLILSEGLSNDEIRSFKGGFEDKYSVVTDTCLYVEMLSKFEDIIDELIIEEDLNQEVSDDFYNEIPNGVQFFNHLHLYHYSEIITRYFSKYLEESYNMEYNLIQEYIKNIFKGLWTINVSYLNEFKNKKLGDDEIMKKNSKTETLNTEVELTMSNNHILKELGRSPLNIVEENRNLIKNFIENKLENILKTKFDKDPHEENILFDLYKTLEESKRIDKILDHFVDELVEESDKLKKGRIISSAFPNFNKHVDRDCYSFINDKINYLLECGLNVNDLTTLLDVSTKTINKLIEKDYSDLSSEDMNKLFKML